MLRLEKKNVAVCTQDFPPAAAAAQLYEETVDGHLTEESLFAPSPFRSAASEQRCTAAFLAYVPDVTVLLNDVCNRDYSTFQNALLKLIELTVHYSN